MLEYLFITTYIGIKNLNNMKIGDKLIDLDNSFIEYVKLYNKDIEKEENKMLIVKREDCIIKDIINDSIQVYISKCTNHGINCLQWFRIENFNKRFKLK